MARHVCSSRGCRRVPIRHFRDSARRCARYDALPPWLFSFAGHVTRGRAGTVPSLGASACAFAVLTFYMLEYPKGRLYVMGIPMTCEQALQLSVLVNSGGVVVSFFRHTGIDWMAHLGGILVAYLAFERAKRRHKQASSTTRWPF